MESGMENSSKTTQAVVAWAGGIARKIVYEFVTIFFSVTALLAIFFLVIFGLAALKAGGLPDDPDGIAWYFVLVGALILASIGCFVLRRGILHRWPDVVRQKKVLVAQGGHPTGWPLFCWITPGGADGMLSA